MHRSTCIRHAALLASVAFALLFAAPVLADHALPFTAPETVLDAGGAATAVAVGDVDGDGFEDIVSWSYGLVVQFGSAAHGVSPRVRIYSATLGIHAVGIALADLDGVPGAEIVTCSLYYPEGDVPLWRCLPDRTFQAIPIGDYDANTVVAGDFDADGDADLAFAGYDEVFVVRNDGGFAFSTAAVLPMPNAGWQSRNYSLVVGDFNGDGRDDLARACHFSYSPPTLIVALSTANPFQFQLQSTYYATYATYSVALAAVDLDADGDDDLALAGPVSLVLFRSSTGIMTHASTIPFDVGPNCIAGGDLDGDGRTDLVIGAPATDQVLWLRNTADFVLAAPQARDAGGEPSGLAWYDADGDGRREPLVACQTGVPLVSYPSGPDELPPFPAFAVGPGAGAVQVGDFDGDGRGDFATLTENAPSSITLYRTGADGLTRTRSDLPLGGVASDLLVADVNADGSADLVTVHGGVPALLTVRRANGAGGFLPPLTFDAPPGPQSVHAADLDQDGTLDLIVLGNQYFARPYRGDGAGGFVARPDVALPPATKGLAVHELTGDGRPDLVALPGFGANDFTLLPAAGAPFAFVPGLGQTSPGGASTLEAIDANSDGRLDLILAGNAVGIGPSLALNLGGGAFTAPTPLDAASHVLAMRGGDVDGDAIPDLVVFGRIPDGQSTRGSVLYLRGRGDGSFDVPDGFMTAHDPRALALGDVTNDGRPDILVACDAEDVVQVVVNQSAGTVAVAPAPSGLALRVSPTPSVGPLRVEFAGRPQAPVRVELFTVTGRRVGIAAEARAGDDGRARVALAAPARAGVYLVRALQAGRSIVARAVFTGVH